MEQIVYVDGSFVPAAEAKVSVFDRGFLFADVIYEVSAVLDGKLIDNDAHLARLQRSVGRGLTVCGLTAMSVGGTFNCSGSASFA